MENLTDSKVLSLSDRLFWEVRYGSPQSTAAFACTLEKAGFAVVIDRRRKAVVVTRVLAGVVSPSIPVVCRSREDLNERLVA